MAAIHPHTVIQLSTQPTYLRNMSQGLQSSLHLEEETLVEDSISVDGVLEGGKGTLRQASLKKI